MANKGPSVTKLLTDPPRWVVKWPDGTTNTYNHQPTEKNLQNPKGSGSNIYKPPKDKPSTPGAPESNKPAPPKGLTQQQAARKSDKNRYWWKDSQDKWHYHIEGKTTTDEVKKKGPDIKESAKKEAFQADKKFTEGKQRARKQQAARGGSPLANMPTGQGREGKPKNHKGLKTTPAPTTPAPTTPISSAQTQVQAKQAAIKKAVRRSSGAGPKPMPKPQAQTKPGTRGSAGPGTNMSLYNKAKKRVLSRSKR